MKIMTIFTKNVARRNCSGCRYPELDCLRITATYLGNRYWKKMSVIDLLAGIICIELEHSLNCS